MDMRTIRPLALALLLLGASGLAGCALPGQPSEASAPDLPRPPAGCPILNVTASPTVLHPGQSMAIVVNLTNACAAPFQVQARNGCEHDGVDLAIMDGQTKWLYRGPDASNARACPKDRGSVVTLQPGEAHRVVFAWDGTVTDAYCQSACVGNRMLPSGSYTLVATLLGNATKAETTVRIAR
jgi:hypothetical protein